jgi:hypothetical protein
LSDGEDGISEVVVEEALVEFAREEVITAGIKLFFAGVG